MRPDDELLDDEEFRVVGRRSFEADDFFVLDFELFEGFFL